MAEKNRLSQATQTVRSDSEKHLQQFGQHLDTLGLQIQALGQQQADWQSKDQVL